MPLCTSLPDPVHPGDSHPRFRDTARALMACAVDLLRGAGASEALQTCVSCNMMGRIMKGAGAVFDQATAPAAPPCREGRAQSGHALAGQIAVPAPGA